MLYKYLVVVDNVSVGVIYDSTKEELRVGGHKKFEEFIKAVVTTYAELDIEKSVIVNDKMKVKYKTFCNTEKHLKMIDNFIAQSIVFRMVTSLGRIMR